MRSLKRESRPTPGRWARTSRYCGRCGWWTLSEYKHDWHGSYSSHDQRGACASLKNLDVSDQQAAIEEIENFLLIKYRRRFDVHPKLFEETVASVYRKLGYSSRATAYSKDGGVDVVLSGPDDSTVGIQVKRSSNTIGVAQIRELIGAMVVGGHTKGIFVTTSGFSRDSYDLAFQAEDRGYPIELIDAEDFLEKLEIVQRQAYRDYEDWEESVSRINLSEFGSITQMWYEP